MALGKIIFISGPSGVGKGTLIDFLREKHPEWIFPPSFSTRATRPGETQGHPYFFVSKEEFQAKIDQDDFLEYAQVHGQDYYGTDRKTLLDPVKEGKIVIKEFDVQGFVQARKKLDQNLFSSIFIKPAEGIDILLERVKLRAPISDEELQHRRQSMKQEFELSNLYDHILLSHNNQIDRLKNEGESLIQSLF